MGYIGTVLVYIYQSQDHRIVYLSENDHFLVSRIHLTYIGNKAAKSSLELLLPAIYLCNYAFFFYLREEAILVVPSDSG
jgi:hypothetical protein